jgi:NADH:ubiquinone oxidoreductase subunit F (NADH-binding)
LQGTHRQREILERLAERRPRPDDLLTLQQIDWTQPEVSICGVGRTATMAVQSALKKWPRLFD